MLHKMRTIVQFILFGVIILLSGQTVRAADTQDVSGVARYDYAYKVLELVNEEREGEGLAPLAMDQDLLDAAMLRAAEIAVEFSHTRPDGTDCFTACDKMYGENIAYGTGRGYGTPASVMKGWMDSTGHRMNILNDGYQTLGVGCIQTATAIYWVQCFGYENLVIAVQPDNQQVTYKVAKDTSSKTVLASGKNENEEEEKEDNPKRVVKKITGLKVTSKNRKLTIKWNKQAEVDGYQIQISPNKSFKKKQTYNIEGSLNKKTIVKYKGKKLQSGKQYYIRIRAYVKEDGKDYSGWKKTNKKVK